MVIGKMKYYMILIFGVMFWGTSGFFAKILMDTYHLGSMTVAAYRIGITSIIFLVLNVTKYKKIEIVKRDHYVLLFCYALAILGFQFFFFQGVSLGGVAIVTIISLCCSPLFIMIYEWIFLNNKITTIKFVVFVICVLSVVMISIKEHQKFNQMSIIYALSAAIMFSIMITLTKKLQENYDDIIISSNAFIIVSVLISYNLNRFFFDPYFMILILALALFSGVFGFLFYLMGSKKISLLSSSLLSLIEPLTAILLSVVILKEVLQPTQIIGVCMLLITLFVYMLKN